MLGSSVSKASHATSPFVRQGSQIEPFAMASAVHLHLHLDCEGHKKVLECKNFDSFVDGLSDHRVSALVVSSRLDMNSKQYAIGWARIFHPEIQIFVV
jgi:hypothetical protein